MNRYEVHSMWRHPRISRHARGHRPVSHSPGSEPPPGNQGREEPANLSFLFRSTRITCR
jgi:hypothetical protein